MSARQTIRDDLHTPEELRQRARATDLPPRAARRMLGIANAMEGMSFTEAAHVVGMERQALGDAVKRYNTQGCDGLHDRPRSGRKRRLSLEQEAELAKIVKAGPDPEVEGISAYTRDDLVAIVHDRFGVRYRPNGMGNVLRRLGFSRQKPRPGNPKRDEEAQAVFKGAY